MRAGRELLALLLALASLSVWSSGLAFAQTPDCPRDTLALSDWAELKASLSKNRDFTCHDYFKRVLSEAPAGQPVRVHIQLGFLDEPGRDAQSVSLELREQFHRFLLDCHFTEKSGGEYTRTYLDRETETEQRIEVTLKDPSVNGAYEPTRSEEQTKALPKFAAASDYFVYIGHSRFGRGADLYPSVDQTAHAVPLQQLALLQGPRRIAILSCDSELHLQKAGIELASRGSKIYALKEPIYFKNALVEFAKFLTAN